MPWSIYRSKLILWLAQAAISASLARADEPLPVLNLKELAPQFVSAGGNRLTVALTGQPPQILVFTNLNRMRHEQGPSVQKIRVLYGKDIVGNASVLSRSQPAKTPLSHLTLTFETADQAKAAEQLLRMRDGIGTPLPLKLLKKGQ